MPHHPEILWAQRSSEIDESKNIIYLVVNLPDIDESKMVYSLTEKSLHFKAVAGADKDHQKEYECEIKFFDEIIPEKSSKKFNSRGLDLKLQKKNKKEEYWPRLTELKNRFVKTDFGRWTDQDEQDSAPDQDDFDLGGMGDMGGMGGGMGGMGGGMGGMGGGMGGMDFEKMMAQMQASGSGGSGAGGSHAHDDDDDDESDGEGPPPLEDVEPTS